MWLIKKPFIQVIAQSALKVTVKGFWNVRPPADLDRPDPGSGARRLLLPESCHGAPRIDAASSGGRSQRR